MKRTKRSGVLYAVYDSRVQASEILAGIAERKDTSDSLVVAASALHKAAGTLGETIVGLRYEQFARLLDSLCHLLRWAHAIRSAEIEANRHLRAAQQGARDLACEVSSDPAAIKLFAAASKIMAVSDIYEIEQVAELLLHTPLPLPLFAGESPQQRLPRREPAVVSAQEVSVVFVSFTLNDIAFGDCHTVQPNVLHELGVEVRLSHWPEAAQELVLDAISVEPPEFYQLPQFSFVRPTGTPPFLLRGAGRMLLQVPQALTSRPLEFTYRACFLPEGCEARATVEGHRNLKVLSFDLERNPQTGYREVDRQLLEIRTKARLNPGVRDDELGNFLQILAPLGRIAGQALQDDLFPGTWSEPAFQAEIKKLLRADRRIGSELEEHPHAAGGETDLSFRGIRIELKVVRDYYITVETARTFLGQTVQYVAGSDRRFGILCILDCSEKKSAPGLVANDIALQIVQPPSARAGMPILVGVVIIRGNLPTPSDLSRSQ